MTIKERKEYNIDSHGEDISDIITFRAIQNLIQNNEYESWQTLLLISDFISFIKSNELLKPVLELMENAGLLGDHRGNFENQLHLACKGRPYSKEDLTKIKAIAFADLIAREIYNRLVTEGTAELEVNISKRKISTNINEIAAEVKDKAYNELTDSLETLPIQERETNFKAILTALAKIKYQKKTTHFDDEINYFTLLKENLPPGNSPKPKIKKRGKAGRPKAIQKPAKEYFLGYDAATTEKYMQALKNKFKNSTNLEFIFMIKALEEMGDIKKEHNKTIYFAFETLFEREHSAESGLNAHYEKIDPQLLSGTISTIQTLKQEHFIFKMV